MPELWNVDRGCMLYLFCLYVFQTFICPFTLYLRKNLARNELCMSFYRNELCMVLYRNELCMSFYRNELCMALYVYALYHVLYIFSTANIF